MAQHPGGAVEQQHRAAAAREESLQRAGDAGEHVGQRRSRGDLLQHPRLLGAQRHGVALLDDVSGVASGVDEDGDGGDHGGGHGSRR
ncbi:MAG: hypothetical protein PGN11_21065 [Quadrisphaera sp.]